MKKYLISVRRMRGPRHTRTRVGWWPVILFVVLSVLAAIAGRWVERHYERGVVPTASTKVRR